MKNVRWFTRIYIYINEKKEEWRKGYTIESSNSIGIKKSREREAKNVHVYMYDYLSRAPVID